LVSGEGYSYIHNDREIAYFGKLSAQIAEAFGIDLIDLKQDVWLINLDADRIVELCRNISLKFKPIPRYPSVTRDLSFLIDDSVLYRDIRDGIMSLDRSIISDVSVFDEYRGKQIPEGKRSLSIHIRFQDLEKTLTDERIDHLVESVITMLKETWQINMR
jgi:phenylalanyl-tRNA synthetase beta chain